MGSTVYFLENEEEMNRIISLLIKYFEDNYNERKLKKLGVSDDGIGKLCYGWNSKKKEEFTFLVDAKDYFSPFWVTKKEEKINFYSDDKNKTETWKQPRLFIKYTYCDENKLLKFLLKNEIKFTEKSSKQIYNYIGLTCKRCGHSWKLREDNLPTVCSKCKSPYWNKERIKK